VQLGTKSLKKIMPHQIFDIESIFVEINGHCVWPELFFLSSARHQRAQAHTSTLVRRQHSFINCLCRKQNWLLCAYERDFDDNDIITIDKTGLVTKKYIAVLSVLYIVSDFVKCNHPIAKPGGR
jgi:hypothetical protein